ncbi:PfkB family carbohydrate kinase [Brachybacterium halotolerans subsp. kimchii]|uniref:PfkB family carbohydrate kinase n=1 Tax=Brachybacterium halotolerans TaxID=2795215 RepID=UPI001E457790|nr:PfkB family carbohydrate kinase [Brachybacterium halotolerans]UEJ81549.1 PfkB family carbohydrate kinase [Brachybacterium halotolerans subsp. kimchii]
MIHTGQAVVDVVLRIPVLPEPGGDVFTTEHVLAAGGGVNTMAAAARDGARVVYAGSHGTGPFGDLVRAALEDEGVDLVSDPDPSRDTGFSIALVDADAERTFVSTAGAEAHTGPDQLRSSHPQLGDVVCVSGYSLAHETNRAALLNWLPALPDALVVVDPAPVIGDVDLDAVRAVLERADVWTTNEREAGILVDRLGRDAGGAPVRGTSAAEIAEMLCQLSGTTIVLRAGADGAYIAQPGGGVLPVAGCVVEAIDTNGAGDAHTGVLCARLAAGARLADAVRRANAAAALAVTRRGPATAPLAAETDAALASLSR